ncbi:MAG TPA: acVLRF1 family peptidyl-tRNA hydrolase [Solirubrobacteraceae bacterium]|nr:acVLRF1 family peptidyl-tRNA hydrolase [Solirubrobacteraceae bacterium]
MSEPERYDIPPERLERWLGRWTELHGEIAQQRTAPERLTLTAADGAVLWCDPPFPPLTGAGVEGLLKHVGRERVVGVLLVRLGGHAAGVFSGRRLVASKVDSRFVKGRHRKGGSSQRRFERRREGQAREALEQAADTAARVLVPHVRDLDAVVLGGDRAALREVMEDVRLRSLRPLLTEQVLEVAEPRQKVLEATPDAFLATRLTVR